MLNIFKRKKNDVPVVIKNNTETDNRIIEWAIMFNSVNNIDDIDHFRAISIITTLSYMGNEGVKYVIDKVNNKKAITLKECMLLAKFAMNTNQIY